MNFMANISQGYYLDEWLICALKWEFDTYVSDTYSFAYFVFQLATWLGEMVQNNQILDLKECH